MSSSEDNLPLAAMNGRGRMNGTSSATSASTNGKGPILPVRVPKSLDRKVDKDFDKMAVDYPVKPVDMAGISIVNVAVKKEGEKGRVKRKGRKAAIKEETSDDSDTPLTKRRRTSNGIKASTAIESSDDDVPLAKRAAQKKRKNSSPRTAIKKKNPSALMGKNNSSDSDIPLATVKLAKEKRNIEKKAEKMAKDIRAEEKRLAAKTNGAKRKATAVKEESDSDAPMKTKRKSAGNKSNGVKEETSDDNVPLAKKAKAAPKKAAAVKKEARKDSASDTKTAVAKGKGKANKENTPADAETAEEEEYKWWENQAETDGTQKWTTLEHNGVLFPPAYDPLPEHVKLKYDGVPVTLPLEAEEVAGFFGHMLQTSHAAHAIFTANFFKDFQKILKETGGAKDPSGKKINIKEFSKCDFTDMNNYFTAEVDAKKGLSAAEKKVLKAEKDKIEEKYLFCLLDGRKEKIGNFRIEPPGLFRGRGEHPKTGMVKQRVQPEQVTINIGKGVTVPSPPPGHKWADVIHDNTVTWLATWKENINGNIKYVMLAATSSLKGMSDFKKFEKARELKKHIGRIRADYNRDLKSDLMADRQRATAMYLIDELALRAGNEKGEDEADTVGCCSLRYEHVTLEAPNTVIFDFLGKDSIRFYQKVTVIPQVFKNMRIFKKPPKTMGDMIFDRLDTTQLNKHLQNYMPGLSAKVFRTYNASWTMQQELEKISNEGSVHDKYAAYNEANKAVAILCNHQRAVSTNHESMMQKVEEKIKALRYQKLRLKRQILFLEPDLKKKRSAFFKPDPEIDDKAWILEHQRFLIEQEKEKIRKKFEKENEKAVENGEKEQKPSELKERLKAVSEMEAEFKLENKTGTVEPKTKGATVEKLESQIEKLDEKIQKQETEARVREDNKTVALGTSKINYIDPRLSVMFCKKYDVSIEKVFPKTLREKFKWALESAGADWEF